MKTFSCKWDQPRLKKKSKNISKPSRINKSSAINRNVFNKKTPLPLFLNRMLVVSCVVLFELWQIVEMQTATNVISLSGKRNIKNNNQKVNECYLFLFKCTLTQLSVSLSLPDTKFIHQKFNWMLILRQYNWIKKNKK